MLCISSVETFVTDGIAFGSINYQTIKKKTETK